MRHTLRGCVDWNPNWLKNTRVINSHTLRGCVDWNYNLGRYGNLNVVTPCVGVWIETQHVCRCCFREESHPAWVCGLKLLCQTFQTSACVTPCVGVWIETRGLRELTAASVVTPCVGVWIETSILQQRVNLPLLSHPAWVCGLKLTDWACL